MVDLQAELNNRLNEYRREAQERLTNSQTELEQALQVLKQRQEALNATEITAPMTGVVKNIEVTTMGAVLKGGDEMLQIVPSDEPLLIEVRVNSKAVAFIRPGLEANVKLDAYDFTVYGSLRGEVTYISADTIDEDLKQNEEPYYKVLVEITRIPERRPGKEAIEAIRKVNQGMVVEDLNGAVAYLKKQNFCNGKIGVVGFCWGGGQSLNFATKCRELGAAIVYYGRNPDPLDHVQNIPCPLLGNYGQDDPNIFPGVEPLKEALKKFGKVSDIKVYPGAKHAFNNNTNADRYHPEASKDAWARSVNFYKQNLAA